MRYLLLVLFLASVAEAAPTANSAVSPQTPKVAVADIQSSATYVTAYPGTANGSKVVSMMATSTDTSAQTLQCRLSKNTATSVPILMTATIPINAGNVAGTAGYNLFSPTSIPGLPVDSDGNPFFFLSDANDKLECQVLGITAGKHIYVISIGGDF